MSENTYRVASLHGEQCNFSIAVFESKDSPGLSRLSKQIAEQFVKQFSQFCFDRDLKLEAGIGDVPKIGQASYISVTKKGQRLFLVAVPHDLIDIEQEEAA